MSCSPAATGTELTAIDIPLGSSSHGASDERETRRMSKPVQRPSLLSGLSSNASTRKTLSTSRQELPPPRTNTRPAALEYVIEEAVTPNSSTSSYTTSSGSNNASTPERRFSQAERNKRLAPLAALTMGAASTDSSASSPMSSSSDLSTKEKYREERARFEVAQARIWANFLQAPFGYVLLGCTPLPVHFLCNFLDDRVSRAI